MRKLISTIAILMLTSTAFSATINWNGSVDSDWHTAANWDGGVKPGATDIARIGSNGASVVFAGTETIEQLQMGDEAGTTLLTINSGTLNIVGGGVNTNSAIGIADGAIATVTQNGGSVVMTNGAELNICGGSGPTFNANATSTWNMVSGTLDCSRLQVGERNDAGEGKATFHQTGGDVIVSNRIELGTSGQGDNQYIMDGGTIDSPAGIRVGVNWTSHFIQNGGDITCGDVFVAYWQPSNFSTFTMTAGTNTTTGDLSMSRGEANGSYIQSGGVMSFGDDLRLNIGNDDSGVSTITISGGSFSVFDDMICDDNATGIVQVVGSGCTNFSIGDDVISTGVITYDSTLDSNGVTPMVFGGNFDLTGSATPPKLTVDTGSITNDGSTAYTLFDYGTLSGLFADGDVTVSSDSYDFTQGTIGILNVREYALDSFGENSIRTFFNTEGTFKTLAVLSSGKSIVVAGKTLTTDIYDKYWSPSDATTLAWYDASDTDTLTLSAGAVSGWDDKSGNDYNISQLTGSEQPSLGQTINSLNVIDFDQDWMSVTTIPPYTGSNVSVFVVAERQAQVNNPSTVLLYNNAGGGNDYQTKDNLIVALEGAGGGGSGGAILQSQRDNTALSTATHPGNNVPYMFSTYFDGTQNTVYLFGNAETPVAQTGNFNWDSIFLNARNYSGTPSELAFNHIGEVIVVTGSMTDSLRQQFEGYLAWKWGFVSDLDAGHPYKSERPTK